MPRANKTIPAKPARPVARPLAVAPVRRQRSEAFETLARDLLTFAGHFERSLDEAGRDRRHRQEDDAADRALSAPQRRGVRELPRRLPHRSPRAVRGRGSLGDQPAESDPALAAGAAAPIGLPFLAAYAALERIARRSRRAVARAPRIRLGRPVARGSPPPPLRGVARHTRRRSDRARHAAGSTRSQPPSARSRRRRRRHGASRRPRLARQRCCGECSAARSPGSASSSRVVRRPPAASDREAFRVTPLGRLVLDGELAGDHRERSAPRSPIPRLASTVQPNLEILAPPDLEPAIYLNIARLSDLRSVDIYTAFAITWDSLMNALDRGFSAEQLLAFLESVSATGVPATVRQLVEDCEGRHGEVRIGVAGPYVEAREGSLLGELEANPRFAPYIQRRIGDALALLTSNVDLATPREGASQGRLQRLVGGNRQGAGDRSRRTAHAHAPRARGALCGGARGDEAGARGGSRLRSFGARRARRDARARAHAPRGHRGSRRAPESSSHWSKSSCARTARARKGSREAPTEARDSEDIRALLLTAVENHTPMEIEYDGFQGVTRRIVEPSSFDGRYLTGFCRLRQDQRVFNTARILSAKLVSSKIRLRACTGAVRRSERASSLRIRSPSARDRPPPDQTGGPSRFMRRARSRRARARRSARSVDPPNGRPP